MSDYLWDKTGEPDADVEQLENLLGTLKYRQRPLEIPADAMPRAATLATTRTRPADIFSRPRLALAASLLLTLLAGMWLVTRQGGPQQHHHVATVNKGSETVESRRPEQAVSAGDQRGDDTSGRNASRDDAVAAQRREDKAGIVTASARKVRRAPRRLDLNTGAVRARSTQALAQRVDDPAKVNFDKESFPAPGPVATNSAPRWEVEQPLTPQQRQATEQLMFALRLASAKFNYAQREMQEIGRAGK
jgi:hypothetical protein